jgi:pyruvate dehydrogenase E2 component (dihydrolipoamide acetyltransferase)
LRKLMILAALLAMMLVVGVSTATAQVVQKIQQSDVKSGDIGQDAGIAGEGEDVAQTPQPAIPTSEPKAPAPAPEAEVPKAEAPKGEAPTKAVAPNTGAKAGDVEAKAEAPKAKAEENKVLPKTGGNGGVSLFALSAGILLVVGGLLARRIFR